MKVDVVVDVGNTRIKWGRCAATGVGEVASLPPDDPAAWTAQLQKWGLFARHTWVVSGVAPKRRDAHKVWLESAKQQARLLDSFAQLPLEVKVDRPQEVGIDRLLNAVAVNTRRPSDQPAVIVDAGSAVTVDWVDARGVFCGGAIFPGLRPMAQALHNYTALLPFVEVKSSGPAVPATSTHTAIEAGVFWSVVGGINALITRMPHASRLLAADVSTVGAIKPVVFLGGGDARVLAPALDSQTVLWPQMTLEGIRVAASALAD